MAVDINNNAGGTSGTQNVGVFVQKVGNSTQIKDNTTRGDTSIVSVTGHWSERYDDPTYYS